MFVIIVLVLLFSTVMQLFKHCFQLCGNRQTEVASVLDEGNTLVGNVEENDGSTQYRAGTDNLCVNDVADADKGKDQHLLEDALEADCRGQLLIDNGPVEIKQIKEENTLETTLSLGSRSIFIKQNVQQSLLFLSLFLNY